MLPWSHDSGAILHDILMANIINISALHYIKIEQNQKQGNKINKKQRGTQADSKKEEH